MNWFKRVRTEAKAKSRALQSGVKAKAQALQDKQTIRQYKTSGLAQQCMQCKHFVYRVEKPRNWVCRCPDAEMRFYGNTCLGFKYGEHPEMVVANSR